MEFHTLVLAAVDTLSVPMLLAYWFVAKVGNLAHLELLCRRDRGLSADSSRFRMFQRYQNSLAVGFLVLLLGWGSAQFVMSDSKTFTELFLSLAFAPSLIACTLIAEHYRFADLLNSIGGGQRADQSVVEQLIVERKLN